MSLRRVDARFLLPRTPARATVLGGLDGWRRGLEEAGIEVASGGELDVVVARAALARDAAATGAPILLLEDGDPRRALAGSGFSVERYLALPGTERPELFVPVGSTAPAAYAFGTLSAPAQRWKTARNALVAKLLGRGVAPAAGRLVSVATRAPAPPELVARATAFGVEPAAWLLSLGEGDVTRRGVFHVFGHGGTRPSWAVKFARVPGLEDRFDLEEAGLDLVARSGGSVAAHTPRLLGRFSAGPLAASVEEAAPGTRLTDLLLSHRSRAEKLRVVERLAEWLAEVARETAGPPASLEPERARLAALGDDAASAVATLPPIASVLQHSDLGTTNVIVDGDAFSVVDWEDARPQGMPLWDAVYLLSDALALVDGVPTLEDGPRAAHFTQLFRGDLETSPLVLDALRAVAGATGVSQRSAAIVTWLCWLDLRPALARAWADDPALGFRWDAFGR